MYKFSTDISKNEYELFIKNFSKAPITQDYKWANVKHNWDNKICGLYKDNALVATSLLLIKKLPMGIKMIYSPRGFLIDYTNKTELKHFTDGITKYAKSINAFVVKIDPFIAIKEENLQYVEGKIKEDICPKNYSIDSNIAMTNLVDLGYIHQGYRKKLNEYIQPRFNMTISLINKDNKFLTEKELVESFRRNAKRYHGEFQEKRGVSFICSHNTEYIEEFCRIINSTEERQGIALRDKTYFERIMNSFGNSAYMFLAQVDVNKYLDFLNIEIINETDEEKSNKLKNQLEDAINVKKNYGDKVCIAATLAIVPPNENGIRRVEYLYAGTDANIFPYFNSNASLHIHSFIEFLNLGYHYADLGGVNGELDDHLSKTKEKYNPVLFEFVGEYDLCINKFVYFIFTKFKTQLKSLYRKITKLLKR